MRSLEHSVDATISTTTYLTRTMHALSWLTPLSWIQVTSSRPTRGPAQLCERFDPNCRIPTHLTALKNSGWLNATLICSAFRTCFLQEFFEEALDAAAAGTFKAPAGDPNEDIDAGPTPLE